MPDRPINSRRLLVVLQDVPEAMKFTGIVTGGSEDGRKVYVTMDWENA